MDIYTEQNILVGLFFRFLMLDFHASWWSNWSTADATSDAYSAKLRKPVAPLQLQLANPLTFTVRIPHILLVDWFNSHISKAVDEFILNPCLLLISLVGHIWSYHIQKSSKIPGFDWFFKGRFTGTEPRSSNKNNG